MSEFSFFSLKLDTLSFSFCGVSQTLQRYEDGEGCDHETGGDPKEMARPRKPEAPTGSLGARRRRWSPAAPWGRKKQQD